MLSIPRSKGLALLAVALAACHVSVFVQGHGGGLHEWDFSDPSRNQNRYLLAKCNAWAPLAVPTTFVSLGLTGPIFNPASSTPTLQVTGDVNLWLYQSANCTDRPQSALGADYVNITYAGTGLPYANKPTYAYGFSGNCSAPTDLFRFNLSLGDNRFNIMWWGNVSTDDNGTLFGTAPNNGYTTWGATPLKSIILFVNPADSPLLCCNLEYNALPTAEYYNSGSYCVNGPPPPSPPSPPSPPLPPPPPHRSPPPRVYRRRPPPPRRYRRYPPPNRRG